MTISKKITLRDSASPTYTVDLIWIPENVRPNIVAPDSTIILNDGTVAIDYGIDKKVWDFSVNIEKDAKTTWTAANLATVQSLYALRFTQTIQLVETWTQASTVYTVHFKKFKILRINRADQYFFSILEA